MADRQEAWDLVYLVSCAVNDVRPDQGSAAAMNIPEVCRLAEQHMLAGAAAFSLERSGYKDQKTSGSIANAMRRSALFRAEKKKILEKMEEAGIWHMPLKGAVLMDDYPFFWLRQMVDLDFLMDPLRTADARVIMEELGYRAREIDWWNHDCYVKDPIFNIELHHTLVGEDNRDAVRAYYSDVKERLLRDEDSRYRYHFSPEDFYLYMIAHEYRHYSTGGTGLRSLLDTYVYLQKHAPDMDYIAAETEKMGLRSFEELNRSLSLHLFDRSALTAKGVRVNLTDAEKEMFAYILSSGTFGTISHIAENTIREKGGSKFKYMAHRFMVPVSKKNRRYTWFARQYPAFYRHRILLPFLPVYRIGRAVRAGRLAVEMKTVMEFGKQRKLKDKKSE